MDTEPQINKYRQYMIGQLCTATENQNGCIGTYYRNKGVRFDKWLESGGDSEDKYLTSPVAIICNKWFDTYGSYGSAIVYELYIDMNDEKLYCTIKLDNGDFLKQSISKLQIESLQQVINWMQTEGYITQTSRTEHTMTSQFWDFIEQHLPNYYIRYDVYRQGILQFFIDGIDTRIPGITIQEARTEHDSLLLDICFDAINAYTRLTCKQIALLSQLNEISNDETKQKQFAAILFNEMPKVAEHYDTVAQRIIEAYQKRDCDALFQFICCNSMLSLVEKLIKRQL